MTENLKWKTNAVTLRISAEWLEDARAIDQLLKREMDRAVVDMAWSLQDEAENGHLGPRLRPGRNELLEARNRIRWYEFVRSLGRPAGTYRRS